MDVCARRVQSSFGRMGVGLLVAVLGSTALVIGITANPQAQQALRARRPQGYIAGTVESSKGREAGLTE